MNIFSKLKWRRGDLKDIGGERSPKVYRDWYSLVAVGVVVLVGLVYWYGAAVLTITNRQSLSEEAVLEKSVRKVSAKTVGRAVDLITAANANFEAVLKATTSVPTDPSR